MDTIMQTFVYITIEVLHITDYIDSQLNYVDVINKQVVGTITVI